MKVAFAFGLMLLILLSGCSQQSAAKENAPAAAGQNQAPNASAENVSPSAIAPPAGNASPANSSPTSPNSEVVVVQTPPPAAGPTQSISLTMKDYAFDPANITVKKGTTVRLTLTSLDRTYGFAIMAYNVNEVVPAGNSSVVTFTADKPGSFGIKDSYVMSGAAYNMVGTLTVTD